MHPPADFDVWFAALTGHAPFPWQRALFERLLARAFPARCDIPTGLGKTSVMAVWLLALATHAGAGAAAGFPRRLVYIVNRRTVVDQATSQAEGMRDAIVARRELAQVRAALACLPARPSGAPLAISTLRGQHADNAEWRDDPARAAIIVGTVDMVGSRLLSSGYGRGFKSRPLHAGFLGQDALLVHDEAHLEPAFQTLVTAIEDAQRGHDARPVRVMALTATSRDAGQDQADVLRLTDADREHAVVRRRVNARKGLELVAVADAKSVAVEVSRLALHYAGSGQAILVFLRRLEDVEVVAHALRAVRQQQVQTLTGTMRGLERDALAREDAVFARFRRSQSNDGHDGTAYLVCTSAGEVGVGMSADHLVCDLASFDGMAQRFGRVNRFGDGDARIQVVHAPPAAASSGGKTRNSTPLDEAIDRTRGLLQRLPEREDGRLDASPSGLATLPDTERIAAFSPTPEIPATSDILFDAWSLTSVRGRLPGRPPVADWLHGAAEWEPAQTFVAWREEVEILGDDLLDTLPPESLLNDYPLDPHELLHDRTDRVRAHLEGLASRAPGQHAWVVDPGGAVRRLTLETIVEKDRQQRARVPLEECTVVLPPSAGGLRTDGLLDGGVTYDEGDRARYDVCARATDEAGRQRRARVWDDERPPEGMRLVRAVAGLWLVGRARAGRARRHRRRLVGDRWLRITGIPLTSWLAEG